MPVSKTATKPLVKKSTKTSAVKSALVKRLPEKVSPKKAVTMSSRPKIGATTAPTKRNEKSKPDNTTSTEAVTIVTGPLSLRLKDKVSLYKQWYDVVLPDVMAKSGIVAGYVFILLGAGFMTNLAWSHQDSWSAQLANIVCATNTCARDTREAVLHTPRQILSPTIEFTAVPDTLLWGETFIVTVSNALWHTLTLESAKTGEVFKLVEFSELANQQYRYTISNNLPVGEFYLNAILTSQDNRSQKQFRSPRPISIVSIASSTTQVAEPVHRDQTISQPVSTSTDSHKQEMEFEVPVATTTTTLSPNSIEPLTTQNPTPKETVVTATSTEPTKKIETKQVESELSTTSTIATEPALPFLRLTLASGEQRPNLYRLLVVADREDYSSIEIYAQAVNSRTPLFLGVSTKLETGWVYWLNTENLPAATYHLYATTKPDGQVLRSSQLRIVRPTPPPVEVIKPTPPPVEVIKPTSTVPEVKPLVPRDQSVVSDVGETNKPAPIQPTSREVVANLKSTTTTPRDPISDTPKSTEVGLAFKRDEPNKEVQEVLRAADGDLQTSLTNFAAANATADGDLQRLAKEELVKLTTRLVAEAVLVPDTALSATEIKVKIDEEVFRVIENIEVFNELVRDRGTGELVDSDGDGLSDYDEINLYGTDPLNPDTDGDGILDGIEIMRGFDPLSAEGEAIIDYESPKNLSYVNEAKLEIKEVIPLLEHDENFNPTVVRSVIRGRALPNSIVTLYIFSTPTVVTVRTSADGSFEYVFNKELEDGEHEVYVALTDNAGQIVARSQGFAFVKTAEAFTYADAAEDSGAVTASTVPDSSRQLAVSYYLVAAMGVVAFGLILLLLGRSLKTRKTDATNASLGYEGNN